MALLMVWMIVALRVTRATMVRIAPVAMLMIGMMLTRICGSHPFELVPCWVLLWRLALSGLCSLLALGLTPSLLPLRYPTRLLRRLCTLCRHWALDGESVGGMVSGRSWSQWFPRGSEKVLQGI